MAKQNTAQDIPQGIKDGHSEKVENAATDLVEAMIYDNSCLGFDQADRMGNWLALELDKLMDKAVAKIVDGEFDAPKLDR